MTFNPKAYALHSDEVAERYEAREEWRKQNAHLALPFFVKELRDEVPPIFPGEMGMVGAASGEGKSVILNTWHRQAQDAITESERRAVTVFASQEETTERLIAFDIEKHGIMKASSSPTVWIGATWGMNAEDIEDLHMTNVISAMHYAQNQFAEPMPFAALYYDYIQSTPSDPYRRKQMTEDLRRLQIKDDTRRLFDSAKTFSCPVVAAAQTNLKAQASPYKKEMPIPGKRDFEESAGIFQVPDYVYSFWLPRSMYAPGQRVEVDNWNFTVEKNLVFFWFLKARGHNPDTAKGIGKVYPLRIIDDQYVYDQEYHKHIYMKPSQEVK